MFQRLEMAFVSCNWVIEVKAHAEMKIDSKFIHLRIGRVLSLLLVAVDVIEIRRNKSHKLYLCDTNVSEMFWCI